MKLFLLRPIENLSPDPWEPWYDKAFGFVIRAATEDEARTLADKEAGDENGSFTTPTAHPWLNPAQSTCIELTAEGETDVIIRDFAAA